MYHHEAMRIAFQSSNRYSASRRKIAVRAYVGGINAVSGNPGLGLQSILAGGSPYVADGLATPQDYVVIPLQTHLDGIMIGTTKVRQFVATPLDQGTTIEAQLTGIDMLGGLQLEFIPSFDTKFSIGHPYQHCPAITTPPEAGMAVGTVVQLRGPPEMGSGEADYTIADYQAMFGLRGPDITLRIVNEVIYLEEESGEILTLAIEKPKVMYIYQLRAQIRTQLGEKYDFRPLFFDATMLDDFRTLEHYNITFESTICVFNPRLEVTMDNVYPPNLVPAKTAYGTDGFISMPGSAMRKRARRRYATMGISAGAKIKQIIHRDRSNRRIWDLEAASVVNIQILNALDFARITNIQPHPSPITRETYMNMGLPWFEEEDEGIEALQNIDCSARFSNLITILPENPPTSATNTSVLLLALGRAISEKRNAITLPCRKDDETQIAETQSDQQTTQPSNSAPTPKHTESLQLPWRPWYNSPQAPAFMRGSYPSLPPLTTAHFNPRGDRPRLTAEN
ncbi:hypothetical protein FRC03_001431 [Tulasnella sp. 419]|nr:hypothetical protein FRC03_001431 [Tulasnella sp. 419]